MNQYRVYVAGCDYRLKADSFSINGEFAIFMIGNTCVASFSKPILIELEGTIDEFATSEAEYAKGEWRKLSR